MTLSLRFICARVCVLRALKIYGLTWIRHKDADAKYAMNPSAALNVPGRPCGGSLSKSEQISAADLRNGRPA